MIIKENKISIIVPVYNGDKYINKCLKNLLLLNYNNYEIVVVNDGSIDLTSNILLNYYSNEIIKIFNIKKSGVGFARNYGINKSTGNYFLFVDVDDYINPDSLIYLNNLILKFKNIDLIKFGYKKTTEINNNYIRISNNDNSYSMHGREGLKYLIKNKIPFDLNCLYLYNKNFFVKNKFYFSNNKFHEDFGLIPFVIYKSKVIIISNDILYYYYQSDNSITRNFNYKNTKKKADDYLYHYDNLYKNIISDNNSITFNDYFKSYLANGLINKSKELNKKDKKKYFKEIKKRNCINFLLSDTINRKLKKIYYKLMIR